MTTDCRQHHPRAAGVAGLLVELDPRNVAMANDLLRAAGAAGVRAVEGDASLASSYAEAVPADVVLACGIFGNISDDDVRRTASTLDTLCAPGATVIWTRHRAEPDLTPAIRTWFLEAGYAEIGFDAVTTGPQSVGAARLEREPEPYDPDLVFFDFLDAEAG